MISFAITTHNETSSLRTLLDQIVKYKNDSDEIIVVDDYSTQETISILNEYRNTFGLKYFQHSLNNDFAQQKNYLKEKCSKPYIMAFDADEYSNEYLIENIHTIFELNEEVDVINVPRWNTVSGLTDEYIQKWGWIVDNKNRVNWPDYQQKLFKNNDKLKWVGKVHERLFGSDKISFLPADEVYCYYHPKSLDRQIKQNTLYNTIVR